uniref:Uncharacterized protein n=1 Tax=Equus asinus asinus TaxID=83772 RepID=A0A8C4MYI0_EQUAS
MMIDYLFFLMPFLFSFLRVLFPFSCNGNRGFCFPFRIPPKWEEIDWYLLPTQKCCRRAKKE